MAPPWFQHGSTGYPNYHPSAEIGGPSYTPCLLFPSVSPRGQAEPSCAQECHGRTAGEELAQFCLTPGVISDMSPSPPWADGSVTLTVLEEAHIGAASVSSVSSLGAVGPRMSHLPGGNNTGAVGSDGLGQTLGQPLASWVASGNLAELLRASVSPSVKWG